jgi:hypothetical protein
MVHPQKLLHGFGKRRFEDRKVGATTTNSQASIGENLMFELGVFCFQFHFFSIYIILRVYYMFVNSGFSQML